MYALKVLVAAALAASLIQAHEHPHADPHEDTHEDLVLHAPSQTDTIISSQLTPVPHVGHHHHGVPILDTSLLPEERLFWENYNSTTSYFAHPSDHRGSLYAHVVLGLLSVVFVYPMAMVFKNLSMVSWYLGGLVLHSGLTVSSLFAYSVFMNSIPDLYPGNAYNKMSWILFFSTVVQLVTAVMKYAYNANSDVYHPIGLDENGLEGSSVGSPATNLFEFSRNSSNSMSYSESDELKTSNNAMLALKPPSTSSWTGRLFGLPIFKKISSSIYLVVNFTFNFLHWAHFFFFMIYVPTGLATFLILGEGSAVFNLLAHFIKGGVFFAYGILTLARYCGAFTGKGWAWNHHYVTAFNNNTRWNKIQSKGLVTMEFLESSLILFYGCTNIFLEHLSNAGGAWSAKDLQHASIAFIFIGCGLCGVITEIKLNTWRFEKSNDDFAAMKDVSDDSFDNIIKSSPGFSPNPFPVITIFWTGILMSKHQQASETSTEIHTQWGNMFIISCAFRLITYVMILLGPTNKLLTRPSRPMTELIVSFGLLCGGLIFMESTDPVIYIFEYYGLTPMFTLNLSLGLIALFMGWEMLLFAIKDWLVSKRKLQ
ncbi:uncharacterized protein CANTADRAFT_7924 [Suhomyces tanzawaensis NRRL Y-17324]|uniref:Uncharacterized protein n=1 Tax=Suhomyces tanzawaensis NRRL Y-17324 TaxID=984487 RepID=A0A1E4SD66_9ASCO|nr:uncharacterized protein CANTADRAFT_7924 [Suhomyces tanzawaensis NRRL Y-17324]ODV77460.1 hypothetical protein CANTADRAFT_7924 [Suhomyces tanzawaensis NRRL Y-17324]